MLQAIFDALGTAGSGFVDFLKSILSTVLEMFYVSGTGEGSGLQPLGILVLISVAIGFVWLAIGWLTRLIKMRG